MRTDMNLRTDMNRIPSASSLGRTAMVAVAALALPLMGCDDEEDGNGTGPGQASATVQVTDEPDGTPAQRGAGARAALADATGTFTAQAEATLIAEGGAEADLGDPVAVTVDLQTGQAVAVFTSVDVPADTYAAARLTLTGVDVLVESGSTLDLTAGPLTLMADVMMTVENDETVVIEGNFSAPQQVSGGGSVTAVVNLNSAVWLDASTVDQASGTGTVAASEIEAAATVTAEAAAGAS